MGMGMRARREAVAGAAGAVRSYVDIGRLFAKGRQMILVVILCAVPLCTYVLYP